MLAKAREAAAAAGVDLELREGDMRELSLDEPAALIYCPYRSLLHLPTWADRRRVFERVAAALRPGGRFAWNAFVFDPHIAVRMDGVARPHLDSETLWEYAAHHPEDNRIDITAYVGEPGHEPRNLQLWWLTRSEWEGLIDVAGLEVEALYGWFDKRPFDDESREFVWVARKPAGSNASPYDAIAELYDPWSRSVTEDVPFYVAEARKAGGPVVELGRRNRTDRGADRGRPAWR